MWSRGERENKEEGRRDRERERESRGPKRCKFVVCMCDDRGFVIYKYRGWGMGGEGASFMTKIKEYAREEKKIVEWEKKIPTIFLSLFPESGSRDLRLQFVLLILKKNVL